MPRITQSNVMQHLFVAAKTYARLTGEQVGIILSNKGNITVIGRVSRKGRSGPDDTAARFGLLTR